MGPPDVHVVLVVVLLGLTATLQSGHSTVCALGSSVRDDDTTGKGQDTQRTPLQRRQDLLDDRLNALHTQLNGLSTGLSSHQTEVNVRLNRMDSRLDGIEAAISASIEASHKAESSVMQFNLSSISEFKKQEARKLLSESLGWQTSGTYTIAPERNASFDVYCEQGLDGGGWTVFQARKDGTVDFYRNWYEYTVGFGDIRGEFWLGNRYIHLLTKHHDHQLKIELMSPEGEVKYADYGQFWVTEQADKFRLHVAAYTGSDPPGDSMTERHNGSRFSTKYQDNDLSPGRHCANEFFGGWWYGGCHHANLNGKYGSRKSGVGLNWESWKGWTISMKATRLMTRKRP